MRERRLWAALFCLLVFVGLLTGCSGKEERTLNRMLVELAGSDATVDASDWKQLTDYVDAHKKHFKSFYDDGKLDSQALRQYVENFFGHRREPIEVSFVGIEGEQPVVSLYLERSGSMTAYDTRDGDGSFKAAIMQLLNSLPQGSEENKIYVVNSEINAYPEGFARFLSDKDIFESTKGIGDASYTDFAAIFRQLLGSATANEISILVTDMIYSTRDMAGVNPEKTFAEAQSMTNAVFREQVEDRSMLFVKMNASYNGFYYPYNSPKGGVGYNGRRPYYIVVTGSNDNMKRVSGDADYAQFRKFDELRGFEHMYLYAADDIYSPHYTLLLTHPDIRGRFHPKRGQSERITKIEGVGEDRDSGDLRLVMAVDLSGMLIDDDYLTNPDNYLVSADDKVKIDEIKPIGKTDVSAAEKKYVGNATHLFVLSLDKFSHRQKIDIRLQNRLPEWVEQSSSDNDADTGAPNFATTTFGLKYLMQGIYDSYGRKSHGNQAYFEMELELNK